MGSSVNTSGWGLRLTSVILIAMLTVSAPAQGAAGDISPVDERGPLSIGLYAGELYKSEYLWVLFKPKDIQFSSSYLVAANFDYRLYKFPGIPLQFEGEFDVAKRFHGADEVDIVLAPFLRWTSFPWNKFLYTNARLSALGLSYATGVSSWELQNSGNSHGSNLQQFGSVEMTFAARENARSEVFVRVHHRSGIYGLINGVSGGSNYLSLGLRVFW
jgi:hypothetical protein